MNFSLLMTVPCYLDELFKLVLSVSPGEDKTGNYLIYNVYPSVEW